MLLFNIFYNKNGVRSVLQDMERVLFMILVRKKQFALEKNFSGYILRNNTICVHP